MASNLINNSQLATISNSRSLKSHSLTCEWSLWYYEKENGKSWDECFHEVAVCKSIEEFWILFNSIKLPTDIQDGCNYALFRSAVRPMWEDEQNRNGGRWIITLDKRVDNDEVNRLWLDTLVLILEDQLTEPSSICGVIFQNRWKYSKIAIWVSKSTPQEFVRREIQTKLRLTDSVQCVFESHKNCMPYQ